MYNILINQILPILLILWIFAILIVPMKVGNYYNKERCLSKDNTIRIKGIACIMVVITHICAQLKGEGILALPADIGFLAVGIFFFCSGYGLMYNYKFREDYVQGFFKRRLFPILIPFWMTNIIYIIAKIIADSKKIRIMDIFQYVLGTKLICGNLWYIQCIIVLYFIFFICARFIKNKKLMFVLLIILSLLYNFLWQINYKIFGQMIPFTIGLIIANYDGEKIKEIIKRRYCVMLLVGMLIFSISFLYDAVIRWHISFGSNHVLPYFMGVIAENLFVLLIILLLMRIKITSKISYHIGIISYEIYLLHQLCIDLSKYIAGGKIFFVLILGVTFSIIIGLFFNILTRKAIKILVR